jgi:hypothetical protein
MRFPPATASLVFLLCVGDLSAQQAQEKKFAHVEGRVIHAITGAPIVRANVILTALTAPSVTPTLAAQGAITGAALSFPGSTIPTGIEGKFTAERLEPGNYMVRVERSGFISSLPLSLTLKDGETTTVPDFKLTPQGVITVKVLDENGDPVQRSIVQAMRYRLIDGRKQLTSTGGGITNDIGEYRLANLERGDYFVSARPMPGVSLGTRILGDGAETPVTTYYPNAISLDTAGAIRVAPGQEQQLVLTLRSARTYALRGAMQTEASGQISLQLIPRGVRTLGSTTMTAGGVVHDGKFLIEGVQPGSYTLIAINPRLSSAGLRVVSRTNVDVTTRDVDGIVLEPLSAFSVSGSIRVEGVDGKPAPSLGSIRVFATPVDLPFSSPPQPPSPDGTFLIDGLSAGRYSITVPAAPNTYLKSIRWGDQEVLGKEVEFGPGSGVLSQKLEILLSAKPAQLTVVPQHEPAAPTGTVLAVPDPFNTDSPRGATSIRTQNVDRSGVATLPNLPPGTYRIYALDAYDPREGVDIETLRRADSSSQTVTLKEGETTTVSVKQIRAADLEVIR